MGGRPRALRRTAGAVVVAAVLATGTGALGGPGVQADAGGARTAAPLSERAPVERDAAAGRHPRGILARIRELDMVLRARPVPASDPYRAFRIDVAVPVDHADPDGPAFPLRLHLLHRSTDRPMVVHTTGYWRLWSSFRSEVTRVVRGNQLDLEHRFFRPSRPADPDWASQLTIAQAAADQHLVIEAFKEIYDARWLSTGASKGGMAATYHRHLYPDDVDGTVAYVTPNDAVDGEDVYNEFLGTVGGPGLAECRERLVAVQRALLAGRDRFLGRFRDYWPRSTFRVLGGAERAYEISVTQMYWLFWQYGGPEDCGSVPDAGARDRRLFAFASRWGSWAVDDGFVRDYQPWYFQAATQTGYPEAHETPYADLLHHPGADVAESFVLPKLRPVSFDGTALTAVDQWVRTEASRLLFVNGELDPWTAEAYDCGATDEPRECVSYVEPGGNHGASVLGLPDDGRAAAVHRIRAWAGLETVSARRVLDPAGEEWIAELDDPWLEWVEAGRRHDILRP